MSLAATQLWWRKYLTPLIKFLSLCSTIWFFWPFGVKTETRGVKALILTILAIAADNPNPLSLLPWDNHLQSNDHNSRFTDTAKRANWLTGWFGLLTNQFWCIGYNSSIYQKHSDASTPQLHQNLHSKCLPFIFRQGSFYTTTKLIHYVYP